MIKLLLLLAALLVAGCAAEPQPKVGKLAGRVWDPKLGVWASPQVVADGEAVPRGGGSYLTGRPYVIGGRTYVPSSSGSGYAVVGTASWYGDAFHGRRTANGEVFDKRSITAAHPTLPLPSYVRVTNTRNNRSMIVRVNDRGPYHGGRVMDVSQRVAEALDFRSAGTARIKVEYIGKAPLGGSDDSMLMASLRTDGGPAQMPGMSASPVLVADAGSPDRRPAPQPAPQPPPVAARPPEPEARNDDEGVPNSSMTAESVAVPVPPSRPFALAPAESGEGRRDRRRTGTDRSAALGSTLRQDSLTSSRREALLAARRADGE